MSMSEQNTEHIHCTAMRAGDVSNAKLLQTNGVTVTTRWAMRQEDEIDGNSSQAPSQQRVQQARIAIEGTRWETNAAAEGLW